MKTNAVRLLEKANIEYTLREYEVNPDDLSAATVAQKVGLPLDRVYKTLLCRGEKTGHLFAVISGDKEIDLKVLAAACGDRKCAMAQLKEVQALTGYVRGGVTVLGAKKAFPVYVDSDLLNHPEVSVSAGVRGMQIWLKPSDYIQATQAVLVTGLGRA